ncbi:MAG: hypothetical protein ACLFU8_03775 [Anaerolineales bacterium]
MWQEPAAKHQVRAGVVVFGERLKDVGFCVRGQFSLRESGGKLLPLPHDAQLEVRPGRGAGLLLRERAMPVQAAHDLYPR